MKEHVTSQIAVLLIKTMMLMLALSLFFAMIFKSDLAIGFPKESIEMKNNYPILESDRFSWEYRSYLRNQHKEPVPKFITENKELSQVMCTNYDPYF